MPSQSLVTNNCDVDVNKVFVWPVFKGEAMSKPGVINLNAMLIPREQWMIARVISGTVMAYNAPHCSTNMGEEEAVNADKSYVVRVAAHVADFCGRDHMAIEDMISMLELALKVCEKGSVYTTTKGVWAV